ncbi:MAG: diguanylate cyclase [Desulfovibrionaceae bacterium]
MGSKKKQSAPIAGNSAGSGENPSLAGLSGDMCRTFFEGAPLGMFLADAHGVLLAHNAALRQQFSLPEVLQQDIRIDDLLGPSACYYRIRGLEAPGHSVAFEVQTPDSHGESFLARVTLRGVQAEGGAYLEGVVENMGVLLRAELALAESLAQVEREVEERTAELEKANAALTREIEEHKRSEQELRRSQRNLRVVLDGSYDAIFVHDLNGRLLDVNSKMLEMYGVTREEAFNYTIAQDYSAPGAPIRDLDERWEKAVQGQPQFFEWMARRPLNGELFPVEVYLSRAEEEQESVILANVRDISERRSIEDRLRTLSQAVEQSPASVVITNRMGLIEYVNPRFTQITGYTLEEVQGQNNRLLKSGYQSDDYYKDLWNKLSAGQEWRGEFCNRTKDGRIIWESASISPIFDKNGVLVKFVGVKEDISERKAQEERFQHLALYDQLTGLPNRTLFMDRLAQAVVHSERYGDNTALLFLDLDKFKPVNDRYGHEVGDQVLREVAVRIRACLREMDTAARIGGDEFVVVLQDAKDREQILGVGHRLVEAMAAPIHVRGHVCTDLGVSIGVSVCPEHGRDGDILLHRADLAMYKVKARGGNGLAFWEPDSLE